MISNIPIIDLVWVLTTILFLSAIVLAVCQRFKFPFPVALVIAGTGLATLKHYLPPNFLHFYHYHISSNMIMYVCLPALLFESALKLDPRQIQRNLAPILTLAIPGIFISTTIIGLIFTLLTPIPIFPSLLLGAMLSATDPIAIMTLFKQLGAPKRLIVLVEGESLFNSATSFVTAKLLITIVVAGTLSSQDIMQTSFGFVYQFIGGAASGLVIALVIGTLLGLINTNSDIQIALTTILAYGSFIIAQDVLNVSGVMATLTAGLTLNGWGRSKISPKVHAYLGNFWEFLAFIATSMIFLLMGMSVNLGQLSQSLGLLAAAVAAMIIARAVTTFSLIPLIAKFRGNSRVSLPYQIAIFWGGIPGVISLAILLSLGNIPYKDTYITIVIGAILFTLIFNGLTMERLIRLLGLDVPPLSDRLASAECKLNALQEALERIPTLQEGGLFSARIANDLRENCERDINKINVTITKLREKELNTQEEEKLILLQCLSGEKQFYYNLFIKGHLSEYVYRKLNDQILQDYDQVRFGTVDTYLLSNSLIPNTDTHILTRILDKMFEFSTFSENMRAKRIARNYEELWALYQGYLETIKFLDETIENQPNKKQIINRVYDYFTQMQQKVRERLDTIAEQFPEFVTARQKRLAQRLILQAEYDALVKQIRAGTIPEEVSNNLISNVESKINNLRTKASSPTEITPHQLLRKVPFLKNTPKDEFDTICTLLHPKLAAANEIIIKEGEKGESLFLISHGVVRVSKDINGRTVDIATLFAGDIFGEMALLEDEPRNATCRAITACSLFVLKRHDFENLMNNHPNIYEDIKKEAKKRQ